MYQIKPLDVHPQADELLAAYAPLTPSLFHCCLLNRDPYESGNSFIAIGALFAQQPIGILIAAYEKSTNFCAIYHLFVLPAYRGQGTGEKLLIQFEIEAKKLKAQILLIDYDLADPHLLAVTKILANQHWQGKRPFLLRCIFEAATFTMPKTWIQRKLPKGFTHFHWRDLTLEDRKYLKAQEEQNIFLPYVSPFREEELIDSETSLGLRYAGKIVGWIITHKMDSDSLRYSALYIERDLKFRGLITTLLFNAIRLNMLNRPKKVYLEIPLLQVPFSWKIFVEKRIVPYADEVIRLEQAWKLIN